MIKAYLLSTTLMTALLIPSLQAGTAKTIDGYPVGKTAPVHDYFDYSDMPDTQSRAQMRQSIDAALQSHRSRMAQAPKEVADAWRYTRKALYALHRGDKKLAKQSLQAASKLFDSALLNNPHLDRVPVADRVSFRSLEATPEAIAENLRQAKVAIEEHRTQEARRLLEPLVDRITVSTTVLPMALYPQAERHALDALKHGEKAKALGILHTALSTLVTETEVMPLPLLRAQAYSDAASRLGKAQPREAKALTMKAEAALREAVLLGYAKSDDVDFKRIGDQLAMIEKRMDTGQNGPSLFDELKRSFQTMLGRPENGLQKVTVGN